MSENVENSENFKEHKILGLANSVREELIVTGKSLKWG